MLEIYIGAASAIASGLLVFALMKIRSASISAREKAIAEMRANYEEITAKAEARFRDLAQRIFEERSEKMKKEGSDSIRAIVDPLVSNIREFGRRIEESNRSVGEHSVKLDEKIKLLVEQTQAVSSQANNLADAVRGDAKVSGDWGEIELKRVLEHSGLQENTDFTFQDTFSDEPGGRKTKRTDFIIRMTGGRNLIIDSKNTVASLLELHENDDPARQKAICGKIVDSVKKHIDEIAKVNYQEAVGNSFPQVLMFIPIDEVYLMAMKATVTVSGQRELLREYAYRRNVIIVNSANVVLVAKIVEKMWEIDRSEKNREEIVHAAEELLRRTNDFVRAFNEIGSDIDRVRDRFNALSAMLSSRDGRSKGIPAAAAKLVDLGIKPKAAKSGRPYELEEAVKEHCARRG